jgi:hypothetical protein
VFTYYTRPGWQKTGRRIAGEESIEPMKVSFLMVCCLLTGALLGPGAAGAAEEVRLPEEAAVGVRHLLDLVGPQSAETFQPQRVAGLMRFVLGPKRPGVVYTAEPVEGSPSAYTEVDVDMGLKAFLKYSFNPDIPWFATTPSSLRWSSWTHTDPPWTQLPRLWEHLPAGDVPVVIRGMESVENTPDLFSGAYYRYDLYRTLIIFNHEGRNVLVSLSRQKDRSEVGKRGYVVGADEDWSYFYSGEPGLSVGGIGWMHSYMFDSVGIAVYAEISPSAPALRTANVKWVRGGWSNINVIQNSHIHKGMQRFALTLKSILESPRLPGADVLEASAARIARLTDAEIREKIQLYRAILLARAEKLKGGARKHLPDSFWDDEVWEGMTRQAMEAVLVLESFKALLGKTPPEEIRQLVLFPTGERPPQGG